MNLPLLEENIYKFRDAIDRMGSFAAISSDLKFMSVSESFTTLMGYTNADVNGRSIHFLEYGETDSLVIKKMVRHLYNGGTWIGDLIARHKDGSALEMRLSIAPSITDNVIFGYIAQYQRSFVQRSPFDLDDVLYRYSSGFNKAVALAIVTLTGEILEVNDLFVDLYGHDRLEITKQKISILKSNNTTKEQHARLWNTILNGQIWSEEVENKHKDGRSVFVRTTVAPAANSTQDVLTSFDAFLVIYQDITKEVEMRNNQHELAVEAAKQQMLSGAIHNISNLQQGVLAANAKTMIGAHGLEVACVQASQHYKSLTEPEDKNTFLDDMNVIVQICVSQIVASVKEERHAIDETVAVLSSFRREQKNIRLVADESISAFVQRTLNTFSLQAARHNIAVCISSMTDAAVRWPTAQVHQIIFNLLINAQQAIVEQVDTGKLPAHRGRIELAILKEDDDVLFFVKDNGGGFIVPIQQLFTPRFTTKAAGSGIGLHTSAIMAQSMGGSLTAENSEINRQRGAQFLLRIPSFIDAEGST